MFRFRARRLLSGFLAAAAAALAACGDQVRPPTSSIDPEPRAQILDARHSGGNPHFMFLPPMVPDPQATGTFDAARNPAVEICELVNGSCLSPLVARFTMTSGPGGETVDLLLSNQLYQVKWRTDEFSAVENGKVFRITILDGGVTLGFADVLVVDKQRELKNISTGEYVGLVDDKSLNIKFRIEQGIFPLQMTAIAGDGQSAEISTTLGEPLGVRVADASGFPIQGVAVNFAAAAANGTVSPTTVTTDANGVAQATWTLGDVIGLQSAVASSSAAPVPSVTFTATGIAPGPLGMHGTWTGELSGQPFSVQFWSANSETHAAIEFAGRPREQLRIMGIADGPPRTLYLWRGQDAATIGITRDSQGTTFFEYWEDGCSRKVPLTLLSRGVPSTSPGADLSEAVQNDHSGSWTANAGGLAISITVSGSGSGTTATANFGIGTEGLQLLGFAAGAPRTLYFWRPQDHATVALSLRADGQRLIEYWEDGCARSGSLIPQ